MQDSVFTKIIKGELPSHKVYEDELTMAFLPLYQITPGHVLVVPKLQVDKFQDLPDKDYQALMTTVKKVALRISEVQNPERVGLKVVGVDVPHAHVHVIGFNTLEEYDYDPDTSQEPDHTALAALAKTLAF